MKKTTIAILTCVASATFGFAASNSFTGGQIFDVNESVCYQRDMSPANIQRAKVGDFNQDGLDDILCEYYPGYYPGSNGAVIEVLLNTGKNEFQPVFYYEGSPGSWELEGSIGDFNGDGFLDILLIDASCEEGYLVLLNQSQVQASCAADLTGDGSVEVNDLLFVVAEWGPCE